MTHTIKVTQTSQLINKPQDETLLSKKFTQLPRIRPQTPLLDTINIPSDLNGLSIKDLGTVCDELRAYLLYSVGVSGGHFGANLGVIELTTALHYVFDAPNDKIIWDVGHQAYAHKVLTGRREQLPTIRTQGGLTAFPERAESVYDTFGVGHSSTSISAGLGMSLAIRYQTEHQSKNLGNNSGSNKVVCIIGDGAMSAGMAFEAMNDAVQQNADILVILNDNNMSISCSTGGLSNHLTDLWQASKAFTNYSNDDIECDQPNTLGNIFTAIGFQYFGVYDGHDVADLVQHLEHIKKRSGAILLHIKTTKGKGFLPAELDPVGYHAIDKLPTPNLNQISDSDYGNSINNALKYSQVFGQFICDKAKQDKRLVAITPAMAKGSGMSEFVKNYPARFFDVSIAEQHAITLAAGMAAEGIKPIVAIYSTFLQRGYDQLIHDVALQNLDVTFAIDRAGLVGADGATHAGVFDYAFLRCIPNIIIACPKDENDCYQLLNTCYEYTGVSAVRYPRGSGIGISIDRNVEELTTTHPVGRGKIERVYKTNTVNKQPSNQNSLSIGTTPKKLAVLVFGTLFDNADLAGKKLSLDTKTECIVVNMRWVKPLDTELIAKLLAKGVTHIATVEEHMLMGGAGSAVNEHLMTQDRHIKVINLAINDNFVTHGTHEQQLKVCGLDSHGLYHSFQQLLSR